MNSKQNIAPPPSPEYLTRDGSHRDNYGENLFLWRTRHHPNDTNMLPKAVFGKTVFVKFKIRNIFNQNNDETDSKQPKIHMKIHTSLWISKISRKKSANQKSCTQSL
jgi:hypothetical protein